MRSLNFPTKPEGLARSSQLNTTPWRWNHFQDVRAAALATAVPMPLLLANVQEGSATPMERYTITDTIGEGGSGAVYRAWDQELRRHVAIKRLKAGSLIEAEIRQEAEYLAALHHPNIVTIFDVGTDADGTFVVMELVSGETLEGIATGKRMPMGFFYELADQLCRGLAAAHARGLVHQDFKPGNVMLHFHDDGTFTAKILDFGLAKAQQQADATTETDDESSVVFGSIYTISPEQLRREPVDQRTDIYALGCVFYFTLLGRYPYQAATTDEIVQMHLSGRPVPLRMLRPEVPQAISDLVAQMLLQDPAERPQTVQDVRAITNSVGKPKKPAAPVIGAGAAAAGGGGRARSGQGNKSWFAPVVIAAAVAAGATWWLAKNQSAKNAPPPSEETPAKSSAAAEPATGGLLKVDPRDRTELSKARNQKVSAEGTIAACEKSNLLHTWNLKFSEDDSSALLIALPEDKYTEDQARSYVGKHVRVQGTLTEVLKTFRIKVEGDSTLVTLP